MRGIVIFALGFAAASGLCALGTSWGWIVLLMAGAAAGFAGALYFRRRFAWLGMACIVCAGIFAGCGWNLVYRAVYLNTAISMDGQTRDVTIRVSDYAEQNIYGSAMDGMIELDGKMYQVRVYLSESKALSPGDEISGEFRFRVTTYGGAEDATYHQGKGIFLIAYQAGDVTYSFCEKAPWWCFPAVLRAKIKDILSGCFSADASGFAKALLLGDSEDLSYEVDTAFKVSGIRHIIAVSGLHVSILYGMLSVLTLKRRYLTALIGMPVLVLFAAVAGFTPSVTRACIMVALMMAAMAFDREYDPPSALAFATVVMLIVNPQTITGAGFQLSVASVGGIFLFSKPITAWLSKYLGRGKGLLGKLGNGIASSAGVSLSATLLTAPLSAFYFGTVSLVAIVTNLLTLWLVSFIFYGIIVVCVLWLCWSAGAGFLAKLVELPIRFVLAAAKFLSGLPMAAVYTRSDYITAWLVFVYILLAVYLLSKKKRTGILCCCAVLGLCLAQTAACVEPLLDECRVTVLDVGQGQSILLQSEGRSYLVDCGGDSDTGAADIAAETLLSQGVDHLDGIILTHYDRDHAGAVANLLTRIDTELLLIPGFDENGTGAQLADRTEGTVVYVSEDLELTCGDMKITVFGPIFNGESNENSLCVLFQTENCDILITGDRSALGERSLLRHAELPQVEVLIAGHHGSKYSTCQELLEAVKPEIVIISVGENTYGHPAQETLDRIGEFTNVIYRTDQSGTVIFRR